MTSDRSIQSLDERVSRPCVPVGTMDPDACAVRVLAQSDGQPVDGVIVTFALAKCHNWADYPIFGSMLLQKNFCKRRLPPVCADELLGAHP